MPMLAGMRHNALLVLGLALLTVVMVRPTPVDFALLCTELDAWVYYGEKKV